MVHFVTSWIMELYSLSKIMDKQHKLFYYPMMSQRLNKKKTMTVEQRNSAMSELNRALSMFESPIRLADAMGVSPNYVYMMLRAERVVPLQVAMELQANSEGDIKACRLRPELYFLKKFHFLP